MGGGGKKKNIGAISAQGEKNGNAASPQLAPIAHRKKNNAEYERKGMKDELC